MAVKSVADLSAKTRNAFIARGYGSSGTRTTGWKGVGSVEMEGLNVSQCQMLGRYPAYPFHWFKNLIEIINDLHSVGMSEGNQIEQSNGPINGSEAATIHRFASQRSLYGLAWQPPWLSDDENWSIEKTVADLGLKSHYACNPTLTLKNKNPSPPPPGRSRVPSAISFIKRKRIHIIPTWCVPCWMLKRKLQYAQPWKGFDEPTNSWCLSGNLAAFAI